MQVRKVDQTIWLLLLRPMTLWIPATLACCPGAAHAIGIDDASAKDEGSCDGRAFESGLSTIVAIIRLPCNVFTSPFSFLIYESVFEKMISDVREMHGGTRPLRY